MNQEQRNDLEALRKVQAHFSSHPQVWTGNEPVEGPVLSLNAVIAAISQASDEQSDPGNSDKAAAQLALDRAVYKTYILCRRACTWARKQEDAGLLDEMDQSESDLGRGPRADVLARLRRHATRLRSLTGIPAAYRIDAAAVADLEAAIDSADNQHREGAEKNSHSISATAELAQLFKRSVAVLEALDDAVEGYIDDAEFVRTYFVNRRINDRRAGRRRQEDPVAGA